MGFAHVLCGIVTILLASTSTAFAAGSCATFPENTLCNNLPSGDCLSTTTYEDEFISFSCTWSTTTGAVTKDIQYISSRYGTTWFPDVMWNKGTTSFSTKVTLPPSAKNKWTGYLSLQSRPGNNTVNTLYPAPKRTFTFSACQTGSACEVTQTVPKNVFPSAFFTNSSVTFTAITTDPVLINQFETNNGYVDPTSAFRLKLETTYTTAAGNPAPTPAISDTIPFGPTNYILEEISPYDPKQHYFVITTKSYDFSNVTEAAWNVAVGTSLSSSGKKTNITSMLMTEKAMSDFVTRCNTTTCKPPADLAIKGSVCTGLVCTGKAKSLDPSERYRLLVSYPLITMLRSANQFSTSPMTSKYNKQMVKTEIFVKGWKLVNTKDSSFSSVSRKSLNDASASISAGAFSAPLGGDGGSVGVATTVSL